MKKIILALAFTGLFAPAFAFAAAAPFSGGFSGAPSATATASVTVSTPAQPHTYIYCGTIASTTMSSVVASSGGSLTNLAFNSGHNVNSWGISGTFPSSVTITATASQTNSGMTINCAVISGANSASGATVVVDTASTGNRTYITTASSDQIAIGSFGRNGPAGAISAGTNTHALGTVSGVSGAGAYYSSTANIVISRSQSMGIYAMYAVISPYVSPTQGIDDLIGGATGGVESLSGFSINSEVTWMWTSVLMPILGGGLALALSLRFSLIALFLIILIVFFGYKAWRIWRNSKI